MPLTLILKNIFLIFQTFREDDGEIEVDLMIVDKKLKF